MTSRSHRARRRRRRSRLQEQPQPTQTVVAIFDRGRLLDPKNPSLLLGTPPTTEIVGPVPFILGPVTVTPLLGEPSQMEFPKNLTQAWQFPDGSVSLHLRTIKK